MKLSEAILAGSKVTEPLMRQFQDFYYREDGTRVVAACAIGAACYAVAPDVFVDSMLEFRQIFGEDVTGQYVEIELARFPQFFPQAQTGYHYTSGRLENVVVRLNDDYKISREGIAAVLQAVGF
jgi:hypothetical protein